MIKTELLKQPPTTGGSGTGPMISPRRNTISSGLTHINTTTISTNISNKQQALSSPKSPVTAPRLHQTPRRLSNVTIGKTSRFSMKHDDKDMTYITDRVIAMSFPWSGKNLTRKPLANRRKELSKHLEEQYKSNYRVFNLCAEKKYPSEKFNNKVVDFSFHYKQSPPLEALIQAVKAIDEFLEENPLNVAFIHSRTGKGRVGMIVACWLLYKSKCFSSSEAIRRFCIARTNNTEKGLSIPSQMRYVQYFETLIRNSTLNVFHEPVYVHLDCIYLSVLPDFRLIGHGCDPWYAIYQRGKRIFMSKKIERTPGTKGKDALRFACHGVPIVGDIIIEFYHKSFKHKIFSFAFNTMFVQGHSLSFLKRDLDIACKDKENKHFHPSFRVDLVFAKNVEATPQEVICCFCKKPILPDDIYMHSGNRVFHWDCMQCDLCNRPLGNETQCVFSEGSIKCCACEKTFFTSCALCGVSVSSSNAKKHGNQVWHPDCFKCQECGESLSFTNFHILDERLPYCTQHGLRRLSSAEAAAEDEYAEMMALQALFPTLAKEFLQNLFVTAGYDLATTVDFIKKKGFEVPEKTLRLNLVDTSGPANSLQDLKFCRAFLPSIPKIGTVPLILKRRADDPNKNRIKTFGQALGTIKGPPDDEQEQLFEERAAGQTVSTYPHMPGEANKLGSPICDCFCVKLYENRVIGCVADGCNWGNRPRMAALKARQAFVSHLKKHQRDIMNTQDAAFIMLRALAAAHDAIIEGLSGDDVYNAGTTTLLGGIVLQLQQESKDSPEWGLVCCGVGDCKAYRISMKENLIIEVTRGNRLSLNASDCGGRIGPHLEGGNPDLRNLAIYFEPLNEGDIVVMVSDGVHDNLDPQQMGKLPKGIGVACNDWNEFFEYDSEAMDIKTNWSLQFAENQIFQGDLARMLPRDITRALIRHSIDTTAKGREWMQTHVGDPLPTDYEAFPGKMDHTTCVAFTVGHLSKKKKEEPADDMEQWLQQKSGTPETQTAKVCDYCCKKIEDGEEFVRANGIWFHKNHFRCTKCDLRLEGEFFAPVDWGLLCPLCEEEEEAGFLSRGMLNWLSDPEVAGVPESYAPRCFGCGELLKDLGRDIRVIGNKFYHKDHFGCSICRKSFEKQVKGKKESKKRFFFAREHSVICQDCTKIAERCYSCEKKISGNIVEMFDRKWHPEHFVCCSCKRSLVDEPVLIREGALYCVEHAHRAPANSNNIFPIPRPKGSGRQRFGSLLGSREDLRVASSPPSSSVSSPTLSSTSSSAVITPPGSPAKKSLHKRSGSASSELETSEHANGQSSRSSSSTSAKHKRGSHPIDALGGRSTPSIAISVSAPPTVAASSDDDTPPPAGRQRRVTLTSRLSSALSPAAVKEAFSFFQF